MAGPTHDHADAAAATPGPVGRASEPDRVRPGPAGTARAPGPVRGQRSAADPAPVDQAPRRDRLSRRRTLALQRAAGNRAVSGLLRHIQRVPVDLPRGETLYNQQNTAGQATAARFGAGKRAKYELTRQGDSGVTVTVRISFVSQARNTVPKPAGAPPNTPELGDLVGNPTEIPANDPRRAWATTVIQDGVNIWNGRLAFVGEEWNLFGENTPKRLPVTFRAEPVFGMDEEYDNRIVVHPPSIVAGTPGNPIDAGNYYMNKGTGYEGDERVITAHEYGHLLGIDDEYSQSNTMLNAMLHDAAPDSAPSAGPALDRETVKRMVLVSLRSPLYAQLAASMPQVTAAIGAQRTVVTKRLADAAREGARSADVVSQLTSQLEARAGGTVLPDVPGAVAFQTTRNFSNMTHAGGAVTAGFTPATLSTQIGDAYWKALVDASNTAVAVEGLGDVEIDVQPSVRATTASGGANAAAAQGVATSAVAPTPAPTAGGTTAGGTTGGGGAPSLPAIAPPATLVDKLSALPTTWGAAGSQLESGITGGRFAQKMVATLKAAQVVSAIAALVPGKSQAIGTTGVLYREAYSLVSNAARTASAELVTELISASMTPVLESSVSDLQSAISTEVERIMGTPASGIAALGAPDPNMTSLVNAMKARLDADKAAAAGGGRDPLGTAGAPAPAQDVTYSYQGLMGSSATTAMRADQFKPMLDQFNDRLTTTFEKTFTAEVS